MGVFLGRDPFGRWDNFEAAEDCIADFMATMKAEGHVIVDMLRTRRSDNPGVREVYARIPAAVFPGRFISIENATCRFVWNEP